MALLEGKGPQGAVTADRVGAARANATGSTSGQRGSLEPDTAAFAGRGPALSQRPFTSRTLGYEFQRKHITRT